MVNSNIQGAIPLEGPGFVARRNGYFQSGEYKRLSNVELRGGLVKNRRNVRSPYGVAVGSTVDPIENAHGFVGHLANYSIITSKTEQVAVSGDARVAMWAPTQ